MFIAAAGSWMLPWEGQWQRDKVFFLTQDAGASSLFSVQFSAILPTSRSKLFRSQKQIIKRETIEEKQEECKGESHLLEN